MIGQVIYNLEDYAGTGGLISTSKSSINKILSSTNNTDINGIDAFTQAAIDYDENKINIFEKNILNNYSISSVYKLGIQAPPGTKFYLNGNVNPQEDGSVIYSGQEIIVGRTGIYELDDDIKVTSLIFQRPKQYTIDLDQTNEYVNTGITQMEEAKYQFDMKYRALKLKKDAVTSSMTNSDFWEEYNVIHEQYLKEYTTARVHYIRGLSGIYVENHYLQDLKNVIIDFMYNAAGDGEI